MNENQKNIIAAYNGRCFQHSVYGRECADHRTPAGNKGKTLRRARARLNMRRNAHAGTLAFLAHNHNYAQNPEGFKSPGSMKLK